MWREHLRWKSQKNLSEVAKHNNNTYYTCSNNIICGKRNNHIKKIIPFN